MLRRIFQATPEQLQTRRSWITHQKKRRDDDETIGCFVHALHEATSGVCFITQKRVKKCRKLTNAKIATRCCGRNFTVPFRLQRHNLAVS